MTAGRKRGADPGRNGAPKPGGSAEKNRSVKRKPKRISFGAKLASVAVVTISAIVMIVQFVEVKETLAVLNETKEHYEFEKGVTSQKTFELEQSIDLSKIEQEATTRLGMKRPDRHQIVYIDVPKDDYTEKTAGEVEGFRNRAAELGKSIISHIVEFFSI